MAKNSSKENELFNSRASHVIKINGRKIDFHPDYEIVYDRVENDEYVLGIKIKGVGYAQLIFSSKKEAEELGWIINKSKKSARKSLKEEKATDSLFEDIVFSMIKKFKLKKEYDVERPSWSVFNFRHKNKDAQFAITFDERGHGDFLYGEVLAFGDEKDDIFKYKTDEVKINSYNIEKECSNIIADCLIFIDTNKKITIFESKKSVRKSLKEGFNDELIASSYDGETTLYLSDERQANHGKDPHYEFKLGENGYFTRYIRCDDNRCENVVLGWIKEFDLDISKSEISKIIKLHESKKPARKSLKESTDESFSFYNLNKETKFVNKWLKQLDKDFENISVDSIYSNEIWFRLWVDEIPLKIRVFDEIATDCMPKTLIEFIHNKNIDFTYEFMYKDDYMTINDFVFIKFIAW